MEEGWIKVHRKVMGEYGYFSQEFCKNMAWIDLLMITNYAPGTIHKRGIPVELKRGDLGWSQEELAKRWRWSRGKVIRFISELETKGWIVQQGNNVTTCITIVDYEKYQGDSTANEQQSDQTIDTKTITGQYLNKEVKKKEVKKSVAAAPPIPSLELKTEIDIQYDQFNAWVQKNTPKVMKLDQPITLEQYANLRKNYYSTGARKILLFETLKGMQNYKPLLKKYVSAYDTLVVWVEREIEKTPQNYGLIENGSAGQQTPREQQGAQILNSIE